MKERIQELIKDYKKTLLNGGKRVEIYKWDAILHFQDNWDPRAQDFHKMLQEALAKRENLLFQNTFGFLTKLGENFPNKLKNLLDCIYKEQDEFYTVYSNSRALADEYIVDLRKILNKENLNHQLDERAISFFLTLRNPEKYYLYKADVYNTICDYLDREKEKKIGYKYKDFENIGDQFEAIIELDTELVSLYSEQIPDKVKFNSNKLIFQDIIYNVLVIDKSNSDFKTYMSRLFVDIKEDLESEEHPLAKHRWLDHNSKNYRLVSILPNTESIDVLELHYELYRYSKGICFEIHPEGTIEQQDRLKGFIRGFQKNNPDYKLVSWTSGNDKATSVKRDYKKIVPNSKITYSLKENDYEETKNKLAAQFKRLYSDFNEPLLKHIQMRNVESRNLKNNFIDWYINNTNSKYFDNEASKIDDYLSKNLALFSKNIFIVSIDNYREMIALIETTINENKAKFLKNHGAKDSGKLAAIVGKNNYQKFLLEYFKANKSSYVIEDNNQNNSLTINQILYGPPGTGKTYTLQNEYFKEYTVNETNLTRQQFLDQMISDLTWWQVLSMAVLDLGKVQANEILSHEVIQTKAKLSSSTNPRATVWGRLQAHTITECDNVNVSDRSEPRIFYKDENSNWSLIQKKLEEFYPEAISNLAKSKNFIADADKKIKNYEFVTFHQSFSYEDFVEGIKPVMEDGERDLGYEIQDGVFKKLCQRAKVDPDNNYAIFIDEINRGNVSAIFGELITLIEKDKRAGGTNELEVQLPYSKDKFSVPANLHIYGTMNTADRSVEALDTALRRRFTFKELMPNPSLLSDIQFDGFTLEEVLKTINERIEVLVDRDHTIGHSYFLSIDSGDAEALSTVFQNKIIPLLQEYFYHDYEKMALILGAGFVEQKKNNEVKFASFGNLDIPPIDTQLVLKDAIDNIEEAILLLLNKSDNQEVTKE
ncbi:AAA family ATPase [uncultured Dokdonia sp.]|uniref:McrB family protein n=1 Tax=uncultured Dokdonia sp. TaxID=575653 RepID=UPI00261218FB|nr:AAA family ATPase [uncultured Dokdonia sp.]